MQLGLQPALASLVSTQPMGLVPILTTSPFSQSLVKTKPFPEAHAPADLAPRGPIFQGDLLNRVMWLTL